MTKRTLLIVVVFLGLCTALTTISQIHPATVMAKDDKPLVLDISIDGRTFRLDPAALNSNPFDPPLNLLGVKRGDTFIVEGKIFPGGTIPAGGAFGAAGVWSPDHAGSIGTWICRGTFNFSGPDILAGHLPMVYTTQIFQLAGKDGLWSDGAEGGTTLRAVTGGTGLYSGAGGQVTQDTLGVNSAGTSQDFNLRETFSLQKGGDD
jgi:hypothetical protein